MLVFFLSYCSLRHVIIISIMRVLQVIVLNSTVTGKPTTKVDVYSFKVVLVQLITGRDAIDESLTNEESHYVDTTFREL